jgi:hypothetical protein
MVHGLWDNPSAFTDMDKKLSSSGRYLPGFLKVANYYRNNHREFSANQNVIDGIISKLFPIIINQRVAVGKANLVAHSMGGIVSRLHLQSPEYQNDVLKLITLNTPHFGSQLANLLLDPKMKDKIPDETLCRYIEEEYANKPNACKGGALNDLSVNSKALNNLNARPFPKNVYLHSIVSKFNGWARSKLGWAIFVSLGNFQGIFNDNPNDHVVELNSQTGGLPVDAISLFDDIYHSDSKSNENVVSRVEFLLEANPNNKLFANKYNSVPVEYNSPADEKSGHHNSTEGVILISQPIEGEIFNIGDDFDLSIEVEDSINEFIVVWGPPGSSEIESKNLIRSLETKLDTTIQIQERQLGRYSINVIANKDGQLIYEKRNIFVTTDKSPTSIEILVPDFEVDSLFIEEPINVLVRAEVEDNTYFIQEAPNIEYNFKHGLIEYIGNGKIMGISEGIEEMTVSFNGVESEPVKVIVVSSNISTSTEDVVKKDEVFDFLIYPSPARDFINLNFEISEKQPINLKIYSLIGQELFSKKTTGNAGENNISIDISRIPEGTYILSLNNLTRNISKLFVKH